MLYQKEGDYVLPIHQLELWFWFNKICDNEDLENAHFCGHGKE